jgi:hypothetical protein
MNLGLSCFKTLPNLMDGVNFAWWPLHLKNVTLYSSKNNNHSKI